MVELALGVRSADSFTSSSFVIPLCTLLVEGHLALQFFPPFHFLLQPAVWMLVGLITNTELTFTLPITTLFLIIHFYKKRAAHHKLSADLCLMGSLMWWYQWYFYLRWGLNWTVINETLSGARGLGRSGTAILDLFYSLGSSRDGENDKRERKKRDTLKIQNINFYPLRFRV